MNKIIVPTDFSDCAEYALEVAAQIAKKQQGAKVHLVHFYERPISGFTLQFRVDNEELHALKKEIEKELNNLTEKPYMEGVDVQWHYYADKKIIELPELDLAADADLIVMGSHGVQGARELFIGSNTQRVVQLSEIPVLVIKNRIENFEVNEMVFASNFYSEADNAYKHIHQFSSAFGANLHLLKVNTRYNFETTDYTHQLMDGFALEVGLENYTKYIYNDDNIESGVLKYADQIKADLIAMETHGRRGIAHMVNGSITEHMVNHADKPILCVRIQETPRDMGIKLPHVKSENIPASMM